MDERLARLVAQYEKGRIASFSDFLDEVRLYLWQTYRLQRCINGPITRSALLEAFSAICRLRQQVVSQILKYDTPRPSSSLVQAIGTSVGLDTLHLKRLVETLAKQAWFVPKKRDVLEAIDWPTYGHTTYLMPTAMAVFYASASTAKAQDIILELDLAAGKIHPCNYYRVKRQALHLPMERLADASGIQQAKLFRLEYDPRYHLGWSEVKRLAGVLRVSPDLLREAHAGRRQPLSQFIAAVA